MGSVLKWHILLAGLCLALKGYSQAPASIWVEKYGSTLNNVDEAFALALDDTGNVYVTGKIANTGGSDFCLLKYDNNGILLWDTSYNGPANNIDVAKLIKIDNSGNICIAGSSVGVGSAADYCIIKYNPSGIPLWITRYNGPGNSSDIPADLEVDSMDNIYVSGSSVDTNGGNAFATVKLNSSGGINWVSRYQGALGIDAEPYSMDIDDSGNIYVGGYEFLTIQDGNYALLKYDSAGLLLWIRNYQGQWNDYDQIVGVECGSSGHIYVAGTSNYNVSPDKFGIAIIKYKSNGDSVWTRRYDVWWTNWPNEMVLGNNERVYITGFMQTIPDIDSINFLTIACDSSGNFMWAQVFNGPGQTVDEPNAIAVDDSNNVYITGFSAAGNGLVDYTTIKYDSTGAQKWIVTYNGLLNSSDVANDIAVDSVGNIYVTGVGWEGLPFDRQMVTIKYGYPSGLADHPLYVNSVLLSPNPFSTSAMLSVKGSIREAEVEIFDLCGNKMKTLRMSSGAAEIHREDLAAGIYFYRIISDGNIFANGKMIIQ
ncbi:MAG TPA: SBBP repeat-containing protein [Chitinophagaceae bacterium]|nr:SBBP repeat-containing protein [Chitinophagaceae bacterium]